ncbi:MAG: hypothetical protein A2Z52_01815 [Candidatus Moranbacteria bacterium RBG_19FT_COMBO_42_6]|nr:MAG: hypothetical protein A2Z52_01815 [Candidatus Moranbacteria bacterium RBG_19FT_COMBO_42_6]
MAIFEATQRKKIIIIFIYIAIFGLFLSFLTFKIYSWLKPAQTCFDKIKNQNEKEVDCGGVCLKKCPARAEHSLSVFNSGFMDSGQVNKYDLYGEVENPNSDFGSSQFKYVFTLKDSSGNAIASKEGKGYILPGEGKYVVENNVESVSVPASAQLEIKGNDWLEFKDYEKPQLKIINKNYNEISSGVGFSEAVGLLRNESPFDFSAIKIGVILKDENGKIIALNSTQINDVRSGENREFRVFWPNKFFGSVRNMEVQPEVNIFDSESFAERYIDSQKFQEYEYK